MAVAAVVAVVDTGKFSRLVIKKRLLTFMSQPLFRVNREPDLNYPNLFSASFVAS